MTHYTEHHCSVCNKIISESVAFCPYCGVSINEHPVRAVVVEQPVTCGWCHIQFPNESAYNTHKCKPVKCSLVGAVMASRSRVIETDVAGGSIRGSSSFDVIVIGEHWEAIDEAEQKRVESV